VKPRAVTAVDALASRHDQAAAGMRGVRDALLATERLRRVLRSSVEGALAQEQLSVTQWLILSDIALDGGNTLTHFARLLSKDAGSLSRAIHRMVLRDLLSHARNAQDRRSTDLSLTATGQALFARVSRGMEQLAGTLDRTMGTVWLEAMLTAMESTVTGPEKGAAAAG
jgi:DNA-binding MarR family transcriptional regulator